LARPVQTIYGRVTWS